MEEKNTQLNNEKKEPKIIHTYMSDMAKAVRQNEMSVIKIALEEQKRREYDESYLKKEGTPKKKLFWIIGGIIIIFIALAIAYFAIQKEKERNTPILIPENTESLISYDEEKSIDVTNITNKNDFINIIAKELSEENNSESIKSLYLKQTTNEIINQFPLKSFLSLIEIDAPSQLIRSFSEEYMLGAYTPKSAYDKNHLFLIIKINNYDQTYAGMLEWEKFMFTDLNSLFQINITDDNKELFEKPFKDIFIKNKDARILYTTEGVDVLIYFFQDKNTLVITDNQETAQEVILRLLAKQTK